MIYDIVIIGGGPAGLTAALYARRAGKSVMVLEKATFGGQITFSPKVENIPGFLQVTGNEFAEKLVEQVLEQGAEVDSCEVLSVKDGPTKKIITDGTAYEAKAVIVATGARHRLLGLPKEEAFIGEGISFCAVCDGAFYAGKDIAVIGGGNSALQEALLLSEQCRTVTVVQNLAMLTGEVKLAEALKARPNVNILFGTTVKELLGEKVLTGIRLQNESENRMFDLPVDGMFIAIGLVPQNEAFADILPLDTRGYAEVAEDCRAKCPGIFVAGDCRSKRIRQVATAASDGAIAALAACDYIDSLSE